jgi:hypothetical protein
LRAESHPGVISFTVQWSYCVSGVQSPLVFWIYVQLMFYRCLNLLSVSVAVKVCSSRSCAKADSCRFVFCALVLFSRWILSTVCSYFLCVSLSVSHVFLPASIRVSVVILNPVPRVNSLSIARRS